MAQTQTNPSRAPQKPRCKPSTGCEREENTGHAALASKVLICCIQSASTGQRQQLQAAQASIPCRGRLYQHQSASLPFESPKSLRGCILFPDLQAAAGALWESASGTTAPCTEVCPVAAAKRSGMPMAGSSQSQCESTRTMSESHTTWMDMHQTASPPRQPHT